MDVGDKNNSATSAGGAERRQQNESLRQKEPALQRLAAEGNKEEFFHQIIPLLRPLKAYIKRSLRIAYLTRQIRTPLATSGDIVDEAVLEAYQNYMHKPQELTLEQWLYQIASRKLESYISNQKSKEARLKSLEAFTQAELRTLEELPITADAEGEIWLPEDLDDSEYVSRQFDASADRNNPEKELERKESLRQVFEALCHLPDRDRLVFDLVAIEGFSPESASNILNISRDSVQKIVERTKAWLLEYIQGRAKETSKTEKKAS